MRPALALCALSAIAALAADTTAILSPVRPHIVMMLADDLGFNNVGWRNAEIRSPTLDALRADGVSIDRHYTYKYCSPTRSALMSGRLPYHVNQNNKCNDEASTSGIDLRMKLLPQKLKTAGYGAPCPRPQPTAASRPSHPPTHVCARSTTTNSPPAPCAALLVRASQPLT